MIKNIDNSSDREDIRKGLTKKEINFLNYILNNKNKEAPINKTIDNTHGSFNKNE